MSTKRWGRVNKCQLDTVFHTTDIVFQFNEAPKSNRKHRKKQLKNTYMLKKKSRIFNFKLTLLLNFQWLYIHPFSQLQTASDGKKKSPKVVQFSKFFSVTS